MPSNPANPIRVRFAPSPTGMIHIGSARTALINWLYARSQKGALILRIEDTDTSRNTPEATAAIFKGLQWLGLDWDEGPNPDGTSRGSHGPYRQSERTAIYQAHVNKLLSSGAAYRTDKGAVCLKLSPGIVDVDDIVCGKVSRELTGQPDITLLRADQSPVFHLTNVVDDITMGITHVIRGSDHLSNTPVHLQLYKAFGATPPQFAHIPLILNPDGSKMSKRSEGAALEGYIEQGYIPEALCNYLACLGWTPSDNREVLSRQEQLALFRLEDIKRTNARFDQSKTKWYNTVTAARFTPEEYQHYARTILTDQNPNPAFLALSQAKAVWGAELKAWYNFMAHPPSVDIQLLSQLDKDNLQLCHAKLMELPDYSHDSVEGCIKGLATATQQKKGAFIHPLRMALTGQKVGPSLYGMMTAFGKDECLARLTSLGLSPLELH